MGLFVIDLCAREGQEPRSALAEAAKFRLADPRCRRGGRTRQHGAALRFTAEQPASGVDGLHVFNPPFGVRVRMRTVIKAVLTLLKKVQESQRRAGPQVAG